jgi:DNA-binding transcriptional ArsR family regulator
VALSDDGAPLPAPAPSATVESIADAMFALSSTSRVNILMLLRVRPCTVGELTEATGMEQSAVSHQLRVLREHRIVSVERIGRRRRYALHDDDVAVLLDAALHHVSGERAVPRADVG